MLVLTLSPRSAVRPLPSSSWGGPARGEEDSPVVVSLLPRMSGAA